MGNKPSLIRYFLDPKSTDDPQKVLKLIREGADLNEVKYGFCPLFFAVTENFINSAREILRYRGCDRESALLAAIDLGRADFVKLFADSGMDVIHRRVGFGSVSLVQRAINSERNPVIVKILMDKIREYARSRSRDIDPMFSEMVKAIEYRFPVAVELLINANMANVTTGLSTPGRGGINYPINIAYERYHANRGVPDEELSRSARILALLLVADPEQIRKLSPEQSENLNNDPIVREAIRIRSNESTGDNKQRYAPQVSTIDNRTMMALRPYFGKNGEIVRPRGGRRLCSKTHRRRRSTSARTSKRLRRKTARASASSRGLRARKP